MIAKKRWKWYLFMLIIWLLLIFIDFIKFVYTAIRYPLVLFFQMFKVVIYNYIIITYCYIYTWGLCSQLDLHHVNLCNYGKFNMWKRKYQRLLWDTEIIKSYKLLFWFINKIIYHHYSSYWKLLQCGTFLLQFCVLKKIVHAFGDLRIEVTIMC